MKPEIFSTRAYTSGSNEALPFMEEAIKHFNGKPFLGHHDLQSGMFYARETTLETLDELKRLGIALESHRGNVNN